MHCLAFDNHAQWTWSLSLDTCSSANVDPIVARLESDATETAAVSSASFLLRHLIVAGLLVKIGRVLAHAGDTAFASDSHTLVRLLYVVQSNAGALESAAEQAGRNQQHECGGRPGRPGAARGRLGRGRRSRSVGHAVAVCVGARVPR